MDIPLDEVVHIDSISSSATNAAVDADSTPTFAVYEENNDTAIVTGSFTKRTSLTGNYRCTFTLSLANGFEIGKWYNLIGSATIGGTICKATLKTFRVVDAELVQGASNAYSYMSSELTGFPAMLDSMLEIYLLADDINTYITETMDPKIDLILVDTTQIVNLTGETLTKVDELTATLTSIDEYINTDLPVAIWNYIDRTLTEGGITAEEIRAAIGMAAADLDAQLDALATVVLTVTAAEYNLIAPNDRRGKNIYIVRGDAYFSSERLVPTFTTDFDVTGGTGYVNINANGTTVQFPLTIIPPRTMKLDNLTEADTLSVLEGIWFFDLKADLVTTEHTVTIERAGKYHSLRSISDPPP